MLVQTNAGKVLVAICCTAWIWAAIGVAATRTWLWYKGKNKP